MKSRDPARIDYLLQQVAGTPHIVDGRLGKSCSRMPFSRLIVRSSAPLHTSNWTPDVNSALS